MFGREKQPKPPVLEAPAEVLAVADTGMTINDNPRVKLTLRVTPEGAEPFQIERKATVSRINIPRAGDRFRVKYFEGEPDSAVLQRRNDADPAASAAAHPAPTAPPSADGPVAELRELASLHASGALTDEEFVAAKARLLASA